MKKMRSPSEKGAESMVHEEGYHVTELGLLPEEWRVVRLGEVYTIQQGKALSSKHRLSKNPFPFLRTANVFWGYMDLSNLDTMDFTEEERSKLRLQPGDLLICEGGEIGRTAIWEGQLEDVFYQNHIFRVRAKTTKAHPYFHMYWMQAAIKVLGLYRGRGNKTTIPNLSKRRLAEFPIPLPPLPEQRAIAHVLRTVQEARESTERVIAALRELKKSLMQHLFTYGPVPVDSADQVTLQDTPIGPIPAHWRVVRLGEVVTTFQYGLSIRAEREGTYPMLRMNNLESGRVTTSDLKYVNLSSAEATKFLLRPGDLLFNRTNSRDLVGKTALFDLDGKYVFASYLIRMSVDCSNIEPRFLNFLLNYVPVQQRLKSIATRGVSQANISASKLKTFAVPLPPLPEQREIARILQTVDRKIEAEEARKEALEGLFKTLLHHLMTAKVRLPREFIERFEGNKEVLE